MVILFCNFSAWSSYIYLLSSEKMILLTRFPPASLTVISLPKASRAPSSAQAATLDTTRGWSGRGSRRPTSAARRLQTVQARYSSFITGAGKFGLELADGMLEMRCFRFSYLNVFPYRLSSCDCVEAFRECLDGLIQKERKPFDSIVFF
jgi:hypothetical protein